MHLVVHCDRQQSPARLAGFADPRWADRRADRSEPAHSSTQLTGDRDHVWLRRVVFRGGELVEELGVDAKAITGAAVRELKGDIIGQRRPAS
jgi:hypothetical protein